MDLSARVPNLIMASLRERNGIFYIVFAKRVDGDLKQAVCSLRTRDRHEAEELCEEYGEKYKKGKINPFGGWTYRKQLRRQREEKRERTIAAAVDAFLEARSHVTEQTRKGYRHKLSSFAESVGRSMLVGMIRAEDIRDFCFREELARETQRTYLRHCKMLFRWLEQREWVEDNVCEPIRYPRKQEKTAEKMINKNELRKLFRVFKRRQREKIRSGQNTGLHVWFKPIVALGFYQGLRVGEIVQLNWLDVGLSEKRLHLTRTKNGEQRVVPVRKEYLHYLRAWHRLCGRPTEGLVFFKSNKPGRHTGTKRPLDEDHVSKTFKKYVREAGLPDTVCFHGLRHACGTQLLRKGMDLHEVAQWLGHSSLDSVRTYEHLNDQDLRAKMDRLGL
jgi:site-specific recombinase XerD